MSLHFYQLLFLKWWSNVFLWKRKTDRAILKLQNCFSWRFTPNFNQQWYLMNARLWFWAGQRCLQTDLDLEKSKKYESSYSDCGRARNLLQNRLNIKNSKPVSTLIKIVLFVFYERAVVSLCFACNIPFIRPTEVRFCWKLRIILKKKLTKRYCELRSIGEKI